MNVIGPVRGEFTATVLGRLIVNVQMQMAVFVLNICLLDDSLGMEISFG